MKRAALISLMMIALCAQATAQDWHALGGSWAQSIVTIAAGRVITTQSVENFDTGWPNVPWGTSVPTMKYSNAVNTITKWQVQYMNIASNGPSPNSTPYRGFFHQISTGGSWIVYTLISNNIDSVQFALKNSLSSQTLTLGVESSYETGAVNWVTNAIVTNTLSTAYTSFIVTNFLNPASNQIIRLRKYSSGAGTALAIDDIILTRFD